MDGSVLVAYATKYGSTQEVAEAVAATLRECSLQADLQPARKVKTVADYGAVVFGAPLYMFHWHKDARRFLSRHRDALTQLSVAIFALGPTKSPIDEKEWQTCRAQLDQDLAQFPWLKPVALELFGGKIDPAKLRFPENLFSKQIAKGMPASDIRDWTAIRAWASNLAATFQPAVS